MSSATFFPTRWPSTTFGPGLHNLETHIEQSTSARGWSAPRAAICLQGLYSRLWAKDGGVHSWLHYDRNIYLIGRGNPLSCFMNEVEAKYKDTTVLTTKVNMKRKIVTKVLYGQCVEELVPESQNRGSAAQFAWAFRWHFRKCERQRGINHRILP